jgi:hypothetical protein
MRMRRWVLAMGMVMAASGVSAMEQLKFAMERALEERIQSALGKILGSDQFLVIVKVDPFTAQELAQRGKAADESSGGSILPGIPELPSFLKGEKGAARAQDVLLYARPFIKRISVNLFLEERVTTSASQEVEGLVKRLVDFNPSRNDELKIQRMRFARSQGPEAVQTTGTLQVTLSNLKQRPDFYWILLASLLFFGLMLFLFGPLLFFLKHFPKVLQAAFPPVAVPPGLGGAPASGGLTRGDMTLKSETPLTIVMNTAADGHPEVFTGEKEKVGFSFISEQDIMNILLLLKEEPPLHLAVICYYLRPALASGFLSRLDPPLRRQIVEHLAAPQVLMRDDIKSLALSLKQKVRGILFGVDQFFAIYDNASSTAQGDMIQSLESQTPMLVEKIRNEMFSFDDVMGLDSGMLRVIFRELPLRTLAVALMGSPVAARDRVLGVLPPGAAEIIRQEIEMNPVRSQKIIDDERRKIVHVVRRLVWDKKVVMPTRFRPNGPRGSAASVAVKG